MIEEINTKTSLFKVVRAEGTIIKQGDNYWIYSINFEGCESCGKEEEHKGWDNITKIVIEAKKEVFYDLEHLEFKSLTIASWIELKKKHNIC